MTAIAQFAIDAGIVFTFAVGALFAFKQRGRPGAVPFTVLAVLLAAMTLGVTLARTGVFPDNWSAFALFVPFVFASLTWVALAFEYTGRGPVVTTRRAAGLAAFGVAVIGVTVAGTALPESILPIWLILVNAFQLTLLTAVGYGAFLVARSAINYDDLPRSGSLVLTTAGGGIIVATFVQLLTPAAVPFETALDALQGIHAGIAVLLLLTQVRYRVFETGPSAGHLARETLLDEMTASVAITGREDQLLDFNRAARRTFDLEAPDVFGEPMDHAVGLDPETESGQTVTLETGDGRRQFEVDRLALTSRDGDSIGRAFLLQDVTERQTHEQRLDVLNRVLRHNLRNDLDAIRGFAEALELADADEDQAAFAAQIHATASELADLGTTLARADRLLEGDALSPGAVDVAALVRELGERIGEGYPDASVTVATPEASITLRTDRRILETVLEETIENAFEHTDSPTPHVELAVRRQATGVVIDVRDNGPGIPERERSVLLEGEETPLRHGSGVGLWLVFWGIARLGGDLEFRENDPRGSVVSLRLPDH